MRTYKLFIQEYNIMENDYITREEIVKTNDIYHEIGKIYCQSIVKIKRIDYLEITKDLEREIKRLRSIIKEVGEDLYQVVKWCTENKHNEDTIERYLVVYYGPLVAKINEIRTKLDKENKE